MANDRTENKGGISGIIKRPAILVLLAAVGVGLILFGGRAESEDTTPEPQSEVYYSEMLEEKIRDLLESVEGIDRAAVLVTVDGGSEYRYAEMGNGYPSDYLVITDGDGEEAALVREIYPTVRGVGVVCTGGDNPAVKSRVVGLLSTALGISANNIEVTGMS